MMRCHTAVIEPVPLHPVNEPLPAPTLAYPTVFYPGVTDAQQAQLVEVSPGMERSGIDFKMKPARVFAVSGILRGGAGDLSDINLNLLPRNQPEPEHSGGIGANIDPVKRTFEFQRVFPGSYSLHAYLRDDGRPKFGARQTVEVPAPGPVTLELKPGGDVNGKVEVEGEFKFPLSSIGVQLMETEPVGLGVPAPRTQENGEFKIHGLLPGFYRVDASGPNAFVKSVTWGGQELADSILDASAGGAGPLRILLSTKTATIKGTAPANRIVELIPVSEVNPYRFSARADSQGSFTVAGVRPGRYRVALAGMVISDDTAGEAVTVAEGETATVTVRGPAGP